MCEDVESTLVLWDFMIAEDSPSSLFFIALSIFITNRRSMLSCADVTAMSGIIKSWHISTPQDSIQIVKLAKMLELQTPISFKVEKIIFYFYSVRNK